jgi:serine/threonine-protein kinase HipA
MRGSNLEPAPLYDLVAVNAYGDSVEQEMAMAYGDVFLAQELTP